MKKIKVIQTTLFVFVMLFGFNVSVFANENHGESYVAQLRELILESIEQNQGIRAFDESIESVFVYPESYLLEELMNITFEAGTALINARGVSAEISTPTIISLFAEPCAIRDTFLVGFTNEEYFELIDLVLDFTGIPEEMIEFDVFARFYASPTVGQPVDDFVPLGENAITPRNVAVPMGTLLVYWEPRLQRFFDMGTLGHPTDSSGRFAHGTSHGMVPRGVDVFANSGPHRGRHIGVVLSSDFAPSIGLDVSFIRMENAFVPPSAAGMNITNFFSDVGENFPQQQATFIGGVSGNVRGDLTALRAAVEITTPDGRRHNFRNMIIANRVSRSGDSGAAFIQDGGRVIGTLVAGHSTATAFTRASVYR